MLWRLVVDILYYFTFIFFCMAPAAAIPEPTVKPVLGAPGATKTSNKLIWWCSLCIVRFYFLWFPLLRLQHKHQQQKLEKGSVQNCFLLLWKKLNVSVIIFIWRIWVWFELIIRVFEAPLKTSLKNAKDELSAMVMTSKGYKKYRAKPKKTPCSKRIKQTHNWTLILMLSCFISEIRIHFQGPVFCSAADVLEFPPTTEHSSLDRSGLMEYVGCNMYTRGAGLVGFVNFHVRKNSTLNM